MGRPKIAPLDPSGQSQRTTSSETAHHLTKTSCQLGIGNQVGCHGCLPVRLIWPFLSSSLTGWVQPFDIPRLLLFSYLGGGLVNLPCDGCLHPSDITAQLEAGDDAGMLCPPRSSGVLQFHRAISNLGWLGWVGPRLRSGPHSWFQSQRGGGAARRLQLARGRPRVSDPVARMVKATGSCRFATPPNAEIRHEYGVM